MSDPESDRRLVTPNSRLLRSMRIIDLKFSVINMTSVNSILLQMTKSEAHSPILTLLSGFKITPGLSEYPETPTHIDDPFERS